ncbi:MAG: undecaprenyl-diphosphatase UppP [Bacteroidota bacterium]
MNPLYAVLLGIVQGLTEFLPISSTAHLTFAGKLFGFVSPEHPESWTAFIAVMQLGTMAAVVVYFWRDLLSMITSLFHDVGKYGLRSGFSASSADSKMAFYIVIGTLPVAIIGFAFKSIIEGTLTKTTLVLAFSLIGLALVLWLAEKVSRHTRTIEDITWRDALLIGCAQALALIPGSSRSGTTITAALFLGFTRSAAARFSFLLSIPAVLASGMFELMRIDPAVFDLGLTSLLLATLVSAVSGYAAIAWLLRYLTKHTMMIFVWYRIALGVAVGVMVILGWMEP